MGKVVGMAYIGSGSVQTSTANQELIQQHKPESFDKPVYCYKFSFANVHECHIKINEGDAIYLSAGQGFEMDVHDPPVRSFVVVDEGVQFNYIGAY